MSALPQLLTEEVLLALEPEELAHPLLLCALSKPQSNMLMLAYVTDGMFGPAIPGVGTYSRARQTQIERAVAEAWQWLEHSMLIMPADGTNGTNGWKVLTRRGEKLAQDETKFKSYVGATHFSRAMLHPMIADQVWLDLARGDLPHSVFRAFKAVEEAVRAAGSYAPDVVGVDLMRKAFHPDKGPLTRLQDPAAEREGLAALFAGAIGSYKNPHSHRTVHIGEVQEAQEMVMLASHLLRIIDSRKTFG